jgi:hypothetical protein
MIVMAFLGFFGYSGVKEFLKTQVGTQLDAKLITPEVKKTVKDARFGLFSILRNASSK